MGLILLPEYEFVKKYELFLTCSYGKCFFFLNLSMAESLHKRKCVASVMSLLDKITTVKKCLTAVNDIVRANLSKWDVSSATEQQFSMRTSLSGTCPA